MTLMKTHSTKRSDKDEVRKLGILLFIHIDGLRQKNSHVIKLF